MLLLPSLGLSGSCELAGLPKKVACPKRKLPNLVSYRPFSNNYERAVDEKENSIAALGSAEIEEYAVGGDGEGYDVLVDRNKAVVGIEKSEWRSCVKTLFQVDWNRYHYESTEALSIHPSYWLFRAGSYLANSLTDDESQVIKVLHPERFMRGDFAQIRFRAHIGNLWRRVEYVQVLYVNMKNHELVVRRKMGHGKLKNTVIPKKGWKEFVDRKPYIAPIYSTNGSSFWHLNLSESYKERVPGLISPNKYYQQYLESLWERSPSKGGLGKLIDGFSFSKFYPNLSHIITSAERSFDLNNDTKFDNGFFKSKIGSTFESGVRNFLARLDTSLDKKSCGEDINLLVESENLDHHLMSFKGASGSMLFSPADESYIEEFASFRNYLEVGSSLNKSQTGHLKTVMSSEATPWYPCNDFDNENLSKKSLGQFYHYDNSAFRIGVSSALLFDQYHAYISSFLNEDLDQVCLNFAEDESDETRMPVEEGSLFFDWEEYSGGNLSSKTPRGKNDWEWLGLPHPRNRHPKRIEKLKYNKNKVVGKQWKVEYIKADGDYISSNYFNSIFPKAPKSAWGNSIVIGKMPLPSFILSRAYPHISSARIVANFEKLRCKSKNCKRTLIFEVRAKHIKNVKSPARLMRKFKVVVPLNKTHYSDFMAAVPIDGKWHQFRFDFTIGNTSLRSFHIESGESVGSFEIKRDSLVIKSSEYERWVRYFENGAVILNMGEDSDSRAPKIKYCLDERASKTKSFCKIDGIINDSNNLVINNSSLGKKNKRGYYTCFEVPSNDALIVRHCDKSEI
ncbi:MAG: hypothetical protein HOE90_08050 [Bacteriovoracaceae bacterium]|nr:hypothetical protein [Bacteriovoracaceae bacterium]